MIRMRIGLCIVVIFVTEIFNFIMNLVMIKKMYQVLAGLTGDQPQKLVLFHNKMTKAHELARGNHKKR